MKKIQLLFFVIFFTLYSNAFAVDVVQTNISTPETNCNGGSWDVRYYNGDIRYFRDILGGGDLTKAWAIGFTSSNIRVYNPYTSINFRGPFVFKSNMKPEGVNEVVVCSNDSGSVINRGTIPNRTTLAGQIVYSMARKGNNGYLTGIPASYNYTLTDRSYLTKNYTDKPNFNGSSISQDNECFNIYVDYCGDGFLDTSHGEACDDGNNVDGDGCSATCQTVTGPTCGTAGGYNFSYSETVWPSNLTFCSNSGATVNPNPPIFPAQGGSTSWTCSNSGSTVNCSATRGSPGGGGGGGGGGSGPSCIKISIPALEAAGKGKAISLTGSVNIVCYGNYNVGRIGIDCDSDGNGATKSISEQKSSTMSGSMRVAEFTCTYNNLNTASHPKCYVTSGSSTVTTSSQSALACSTGLSVGRNSCGDGIVQRPNSDGLMEECESVNGIFPSWCINCKTTNLTIPGEGGGILTYPGGGNIIIRPFGQVIIGAGSNPFAVFGTYPFIGNDSSEDIYLDYPLCVHSSDSSVLLRSNDTGLTRVCTAQNIGWMYPGVTKTFESLNYGDSVNIKGVKIINNINYKDTILKITLGEFKDAFFAAVFKVRVSKPAVATVGGGTSLIKNSNVTADINKVASDGFSDPDKNKNFVGAGVSTGSTSSYSKNIDNSNSINMISSGQTQKVEGNLTKVTTSTVSGDKYIGDSLTKYNGLSNVYIVKNGNLTINANIIGDGPRTYIIEGGNLNITQNINYSDNIAFVVKGGDIIISSNVTSINGTFIAIKVAGVGGKIMSVESDNKLVVNGSLYGDIESLVNNRTYIQNKNDLINVGTVVSFGSSLFRKQAPLVGDFIGEYVESKKIAK